MKTLADLVELVQKETKLNEGKILQNKYTIDFGDMRFSYQKVHELTNGDVSSLDDKIYFMENIETPEKLQMVYWKVYDLSRTRIEEQNK